MSLTGQHAGSRPEPGIPPAPDLERPHQPRGSLRAALTLPGRPAVAAVVIGLLLLATGLAGVLATGHRGYVPPHVAPVKPVLPPVGHVQTLPPEASGQVSPPVSLTIPLIGVRAPIVRLGLTRSGALQVPGSTAVAGWYTGSPPPGAIGSSVIAGHVDSYAGPGVFFRLDQLHPGDLVFVRQQDGSLAVFRVDSVHEYSKNFFPTLRVYGPTPTSQLRLITCGGTFDPQTGHYLSNVVVYATLAP